MTALFPQEGEAPSDDQVSWGHGGRTTFELRRTLSITHGAAWQGQVRAFLNSEAVASRAFLNSEAVASHADDRAAAHGSPTSVPKRPTVHALENPNLKAQYLDELRREGYVGLYDFLHAFISSLARRQQRQGMQQAA